MITQLIIGLLAVLCSIGLAVLFKRRTRVRLANIAEGTHGSGRITKLSGAAITGRYRVVKFGADVDHVIVTAANTDVPLGICTDEASAAEFPINVAILGNTGGTLKVLLGGTVALYGEMIGNNAGAGIALPGTTGTYYPIGRALQAGVSGETIEFAPVAPDPRVVP